MSDRDLEAQAAEYVLGTLDGDDRTAFEARLAVDPAVRARVNAWEQRLAPGVTVATVDQAPGPGAWRRLDAALSAHRAGDLGGITVRGDAGTWQPLAEGADIKLLWVDAAARTRSFLLRLAPGARVPAHPHPTTEECLVLSGDMVIGDTVFHAGDYHVAPAGLDHPELTSRGGGVVFIRGPLYA